MELLLLLLLCNTTSSSWLLLFILLLLIFLTSSLVFLNRKKDATSVLFKRPPPGPPMVSTIIIILRVRLFGLPQLVLRQYSKKYGPIMLLHLGHLPTLVISSAEAAKEILKTQDLNFCSRPPLVSTRRITKNYKEVAVAPYTEYWREMRKVYVLKLLSTKRVQSFRSAREQEVSMIISSIISSQYSSSSTILILNLDEKLFSLTVSIFFRMVFGSTHHGRTTIRGCKFEQVVHQVSETIGTLSAADLVPYIGWMIDVITGIHARLEKDYHDLYFFLEQFISEYLDSKTPKHKMNEAIVDSLLELEGEEFGGDILTREHTKAVLAEIFFAGVNSLSVTMVWAMAELVRNPRIMKKVQDEVRSCIANKGKVEESDLDQLQYLKMVIKETLRLHPTAPLLIPRESISHCKIKGYDICPKTMVLVNVWSIGRDPESWENPDLFFPERFSDNSTIDFMGQDFNLLPFGSGRRGCPAISMGNVIMELTLANLLYCFNWELPTGLEKEVLDMEEEGSFTVHKKYSLRLLPILYR